MEFALTDRLAAAVRRALDGATAAEADWLRRYTRADACVISLDDVERLSALLRARPADADGSERPPRWVHELLVGAAPVLPAFASERKPHPALEPRLAALRAEQENREYAEMIGDVCAQRNPGRDTAEMATYRSQMGVGLNLVVSMATMFTVGFYAGGTEAEPRGTRALACGLVLAIATMGVEMALFVIGASRVDAKVHKREAAAATHDLTRVRDHYGPEVSARRRDVHGPACRSGRPTSL